MPVKELVGKTFVFGLVSLACIGGGFLAYLGPHAYNDYPNTYLALGLWGLGLAVGGAGTIIVLGIAVDARQRRRDEQLHITPRPGPLGPPPPWGMGDIGRPGSGGPRQVGGGAAPRGGGGPHLMTVHPSSFDAPLVIGVLVVWTIAFLVWLAPR